MNIGGGEAADQLVRMLLSGGEVAVRLGGSAAKNLLAMSLALAKNHKKISGKIRMGKMLQQTRDLRVFPMTQEEYRDFRYKARGPKLLYAAIQNSRDTNDLNSMVDVIMPSSEVERANLVFQKMMYQQPESPQKVQPERERQPEKEPGTPKKDSRSGRGLRDTDISSPTHARSAARMTSGIGPPLRVACRTIAHSWRNCGGAPRPGRKPRRVPRPDNWVLFGESAGYSGPVQVWLRY